MADLVRIDTVDGTLVLGDDLALDEWAQSAGEPVSPASVPDNLAREIAGAIEASQVAARFIKRSDSNKTTELRKITRGPDGRFVSNNLVVPLANPELVVLQTAVEVVAVALDDIRAAVGEVSEDVAELLRIVRAEQLGEVYAQARLLHRMIDEVAHGKSLTTTDWESIAHLGPGLESGAEVLRRQLIGYLREADSAAEASASERAAYLERLSTRARIGDLLKLLVVTQAALYDFQRLRLVRTRDTEPEHLEQTMDSVREIVDSNLVLDDAVADGLLAVLNDVGVLRPSEGWKVPVRRKLDKHRAEVAEEVFRFLDARQDQATEWELARNPGVRDAVAAITHDARSKTADALRRFSTFIEP